jgi:hypothetical protein
MWCIQANPLPIEALSIIPRGESVPRGEKRLPRYLAHPPLKNVPKKAGSLKPLGQQWLECVIDVIELTVGRRFGGRFKSEGRSVL